MMMLPLRMMGLQTALLASATLSVLGEDELHVGSPNMIAQYWPKRRKGKGALILFTVALEIEFHWAAQAMSGVNPRPRAVMASQQVLFWGRTVSQRIKTRLLVGCGT